MANAINVRDAKSLPSPEMKSLKFNVQSLLYMLLPLMAYQVTAQQVFRTTSTSVIGYLEYLPQDYNSNSNKYPIVISLHGAGEKGPNTTDLALLEAAIWTVTKNGPQKHVKNGVQFPFILITPQLKNNYSTWPSSYVMEVINHCKTYLRIDERRIYITGFSMGGGGTWVAIQDNPKVFAAAAPICGGYNSPSKACLIAAENLPVWAFHGDADTVVPLSRTVNMVNAINNCSPTPNPKALITIYPGVTHNSWGRAYAIDNTYHTPNLYQWLMSKTNTVNAGNKIPVANAGPDITVSTTTLSLKGSGSDSDGSIASYRWTKLSGPAVTLTNSASATASLSNLVNGTYIFRLQVTDNGGQTDSDYVKIVKNTTVIDNTTTANTAPVANAGPNVTLTLPNNSTYIYGSGKDSDGSIVSYAWSKLKGPSASMSGTNTSTLYASNLLEGFYVFRLTVKDDKGATHFDDMAITVKAAVSSTNTTTPTTTQPANMAPVANAGANIILTLPKNSTYVYGSGKDTDGTIVSYTWTKVRGGAATMSGTNTQTLYVSGLTEGFYVFRLTVKDDKGATHYDDMAVTVKSPVL